MRGAMAVYGYARVSTQEQNLDLQRDALRAANCVQVFEDVGVSGGAPARAGFDALLAVLAAGDTVVIWKMDRAFRSLRHALDVLETFEHREIELRSLTDHFDTSTAMGKCMYQVRNAFAELERSLISERTKAGMAAARSRGKHVGRPRALTDWQVKCASDALREHPETTRKAVAASLGISAQTLSRALREPPS